MRIESWRCWFSWLCLLKHENCAVLSCLHCWKCRRCYLFGCSSFCLWIFMQALGCGGNGWLLEKRFMHVSDLFSSVFWIMKSCSFELFTLLVKLKILSFFDCSFVWIWSFVQTLECSGNHWLWEKSQGSFLCIWFCWLNIVVV